MKSPRFRMKLQKGSSMLSQFESDLIDILNRHSKESASNTPDYILAHYLHGCLRLFDSTLAAREKWHNRAKEMIKPLKE